MNVEVVGRVHPGRGLGEHVHPELVVQLLEWPQVAQVEDRPEVHVEPLRALPGEHLDAAPEVVHGGAGQLRVVGGGQRPDVAGRAGKTGAELAWRRPGHRPC